MVTRIDELTSCCTEFYFSHALLAMQPKRGDLPSDNTRSLLEDLTSGVLLGYEGSYVLYQKGVFCGQSRDWGELLITAQRYYGGSNLAVFKVPGPARALVHALGPRTIKKILYYAHGQF
jgi:hypothetical protein